MVVPFYLFLQIFLTPFEFGFQLDGAVNSPSRTVVSSSNSTSYASVPYMPALITPSGMEVTTLLAGKVRMPTEFG